MADARDGIVMIPIIPCNFKSALAFAIERKIALAKILFATWFPLSFADNTRWEQVLS
jgi:hypothetical protein